jgi:hypothetical protein
VTSRCRITDCPRPPRTGCRYCHGHLRRRRLYGNFDFTQWGTADDHDVAAIIREQRPAQGLTRLERVKVARGLTQHGLPADEIARILAVTPRTVYRWRADGFRRAA